MMINEDISLKVKELHLQVEKLLKENYNDQEIFNELRKSGIKSDYAKTIIENVIKNKQNKRKFWKLFTLGLFTVLCGLTLIAFVDKVQFIEIWSSHLFWTIVGGGVILVVKAVVGFKK